MTRVLVTGGAGFIGSHLTERLLAEGIDVTVLDNLATGSARTSADAATLVEGDVGDRASVDEVFAGERFDAVFHIAGQASIRLSFAEPEVDLRTNVIGTVNVLRACIESGVPTPRERELDDGLRRARPRADARGRRVRSRLLLRRDEVRGRAVRARDGARARTSTSR